MGETGSGEQTAACLFAGRSLAYASRSRVAAEPATAFRVIAGVSERRRDTPTLDETRQSEPRTS
jgi:hypothetical protein